MRSLDRERIYSIFAPLDANEPLPREQLQAARRHRTLGRWELAGALWLPMLFLILLVAGWLKPPPIFVLAAVTLTFFGLLGYALAGSSLARNAGRARAGRTREVGLGEGNKPPTLK